MDDLVQWLGEQLDEDERIARAVTTEGVWRVGSSRGGVTVEGEGWSVAGADALDGAHIAEHDPARVLREIDAKRQLLALHPHHPYPPVPGGVYCDCMATDGVIETDGTYCPTIRLLALPYADRPGYREEWRP